MMFHCPLQKELDTAENFDNKSDCADVQAFPELRRSFMA